MQAPAPTRTLGWAVRAIPTMGSRTSCVLAPRNSPTSSRHGSRKRSAKEGAHLRVYVASCAQQLRNAYRHPVEGRKIAERIVETFPACSIPDIARLGRTLKR